MKLGIIGTGAIGSYVRDKAIERGHTVAALLLKPERLQNPGTLAGQFNCVSNIADLPGDIDVMLDCAGHAALQSLGPAILRNGVDLITVSLGALADSDIYASLERAAREGDACLHLASGAIGALDCLQASRVGKLQSVTYVGRKPPQGWKGSPAERRLDLDSLEVGAATHFEGSARTAALEYPRNANVAAAVALAGIGFDDTEVRLVADPGIDANIHEIRASGEFGSFSFEIRGNALPDNPRSSALAAMSVISKLEQHSQPISF
tara:strand:- start:8379 stop:9170 length:792 start_codon:yes stop_codon:yes gene_type:complete